MISPPHYPPPPFIPAFIPVADHGTCNDYRKGALLGMDAETGAPAEEDTMDLGDRNISDHSCGSWRYRSWCHTKK